MSLTCDAGRDYKRAEVCLVVGWRWAEGVELLEHEGLDLLAKNGTLLRQIRP